MTSTPLSNPTYRRLFSAQITSLIGTGITTIALALLAWDLAGNKAGEVMGTALAFLILGLIAAAAVMVAWWIYPNPDPVEIKHTHKEIVHSHHHVHDDEHHQPDDYHELHEDHEDPFGTEQGHRHTHRHKPVTHKHPYVIDRHHPRWAN